MALIGTMKYLTIGGQTYEIAGDELQIASASTLGGIKVGSGLSINSTTGVLSASITETDPTVPSWAKASTKPTYTYSEVGAAASSHSHGNITNSGDITATAPTIANGDQIIINDNSASKITNGPTFDGSTTTTALTPKGTWESFSKFSGSYNDLTNKPTIPTVPTNVSAFTNDAGYITSADVPEGASAYTGTISAVGTSASTGSNNGFARGDHVHNITKMTIDTQLGTGSGTTKFYREDGTWATPAYTTNTDTKVSTAAVTSGTTYYPVVGSDTTSAATKYYDKTGIVYKGTNGTTSAVGSAQLTLGNSTASGTANNKQGQLIIYGSTAYAHTIQGAPTAARTITLPDKAGTVALTSDLSSFITDAGVTKITTTAGTHTAITNSTGAVSFNVPTKTSHLTNDSGFLTSYTDEKMKWTASTTSNTYYPLQSTSTATTSTANTLNSVSFYQYYNTAGGYRRLQLGNTTSYTSTGGAYGTIRLYGTGATYYGDLNPGTIGATSLSANRTWTLPDKTGTIALTSDIPDVSSFVTSSGVTSIATTSPISGGTITSTGTISHATSGVGNAVTTAGFYKFKYDTYGHVTGVTAVAASDITALVTIPTNTDTKLQVAEVTSGTQYYPLVGTGTTAATRQYDTTGFTYKGTNGTTSAVGSSILVLGNATGSGTANNKQAQLIMYGSNTKKATITLAAPSADISIALPTTGGTLALTSDIPTVPTITLNGSSTTSPSFYAPTGAGTNGYVLKSNGSGAPTWTSATLTDTKVTQSASTSSTNIPVLLRDNKDATTNPGTADAARFVSSVTVQPSTGNLQATKFNNYTLAAACEKSVDSSISTASTSTNLPTSAAVASFVEGKGYITSYTDTNTTYSLSSALSSHKFTSTLTAGGSGSGTSTATMEFVAGTGITLTDDTTNKKITIACSVTNTDEKVKQTNTTTSAAYELLFSYTADNTERTEGARKTSTLTYNPSTKALSTGGTVNGYTLAAASAKGVDTSIASGSSSANLPTSAAVASYVSSNATQVQIVRW